MCAHACRDWYGTFCSLAGVDATDHRAALANLPPVDSVDMSAVLLGTLGSSNSKRRPRMELAIGAGPRQVNISAPSCSGGTYADTVLYDESSEDEGGSHFSSVRGRSGNCSTVVGLIVDEGSEGGLWKLLLGDESQYVGTGPRYPNSSTNFDSQDPVYTKHCGGGCLFDLTKDPFEAHDVAAVFPQKVATMVRRVEELEASAFNPIRGRDDGLACQVAEHKWGDFWGPFLP